MRIRPMAKSHRQNVDLNPPSFFLPFQIEIGDYNPTDNEQKLTIKKKEIIWPGDSTDVPKDITKKNHLQV